MEVLTWKWLVTRLPYGLVQGPWPCVSSSSWLPLQATEGGRESAGACGPCSLPGGV
jgi:hypothetical protein